LKKILLTQNQVTLVDDEDFDWLSQWKWYTQKSRDTFYAIRMERKEEYLLDGRTYKQKKSVRMHRAIMEHHLRRKLELWELVDHIDLNGLNNQNYNLRIVTN
jgi:hypothetical protein